MYFTLKKNLHRIEAVLPLLVNHNVGPENMKSNFFQTLYIKNYFFYRWPPYTPHSHTGPHHFIALHEGRRSIAISPGFPFRGQ